MAKGYYLYAQNEGKNHGFRNRMLQNSWLTIKTK